MASLGLASLGAATDGVTPIPLFFLKKNRRPFLLITVTFLDFTRVSPPGGCHPGPFLPARPGCPLFFVNLATILLSFGCHPLEGITGGGPPSP